MCEREGDRDRERQTKQKLRKIDIYIILVVELIISNPFVKKNNFPN